MMAGPRKRSVRIAGHRTSLSLEPHFWDALKEVAMLRGVSLSALIAQIDERREKVNLSSAIRIFLFREAAQGRLGNTPRISG